MDSYFDPLGWFARGNSFRWHAQYAPSAFYLLTLRASALPLDPVLDSAYDPYAFLRDAYRQRRLYKIYYGNPPLSAIDELQGSRPSEQRDQDIDQLLQQQQAYEKTHGLNDNGVPATAGSSAQPAASSSAATPATATSTDIALPAPATSVAIPEPATSAPSRPPASSGA